MNITEIAHNKYRTRRMTGALLRLKNILLKFFSFLWLKGRYEEFSYERHRGLTSEFLEKSDSFRQNFHGKVFHCFSQMSRLVVLKILTILRIQKHFSK